MIFTEKMLQIVFFLRSKFKNFGLGNDFDTGQVCVAAAAGTSCTFPCSLQSASDCDNAALWPVGQACVAAASGTSCTLPCSLQSPSDCDNAALWPVDTSGLQTAGASDICYKEDSGVCKSYLDYWNQTFVILEVDSPDSPTSPTPRAHIPEANPAILQSPTKQPRPLASPRCAFLFVFLRTS